jgi:predicted nucleic acid-binding protein
MARIVVPDASVILKWVLPSRDEADSDRALELRDAIARDAVQAVVPRLWLYEVGNSLARRFPESAERRLAALMKFGLVEADPTMRWLKTALGLTERYRVTFYDAAYHSVAMVLGGELVTADAQYVERARAAGAVRLLVDWTQQ